MFFLVLDSNLVRTNMSWVALFSSEPRVGHSSFLKTKDRKSISIFISRSLIKPTWINENNVYLMPKD
jgi:hypothetical protein